MKPRIEILIPHHNRAEGLEATLRSMREQTEDCAVCVIDNASVDDTGAVLAAFPEVRVLRNRSNLGFGAALNRGAASSEADLLVFLNNDAVADPMFVRELRLAAEASGAAMIAGCLREPAGAIESLGVVVDQSLAVYDYLHGVPYEDAESRELAPPLAPCGGAAAFPRKAFLAYGGFDEQIFAYLEDAELGLRMRAGGARCAAAPRAFVWHEHSRTLGPGSAAKNELLGWSREYLCWKYGDFLDPGARARGRMIDAATIVGKAVIDRNLGSARGHVRARRELRKKAKPDVPDLAGVELIRMKAFETVRRRLDRRSRVR